MTDLGLTVGEIAERIRGETGDDLTTVIERLRNWTKEGLLKPIGKKKPGIGRKRRYSERAFVDAAILSRLARYYGSRAPVVLFSGALDLAAKELPKAKHVPTWQDIFLLVGTVAGQKLSEPWQVKAKIEYVDNGQSRPTDVGLPDRHLKLAALMADGLFINLSDLFKRLGVPLADAAAQEAFYRRYPDARRIKLA